MAVTQGPLFPFGEPIAAQQSLLVTPRWRTWLRNLREAVDLSQVVIPNPAFTSQNASIATTSLDNGRLSAGLYAVSWYAAVVVAAGVSSSLTVSIAWVDGGVSKSYTGPAMTGNTISTVQVDQRILVYADAASPITFATTYASNPAGVMRYDFRPVLQSVTTS